jgi:hypothetical protein
MTVIYKASISQLVPRRERGTTIVELPLALWIIVLLLFSMLVLATELLRFGFFWNACREAAKQAAQCQTFQTDSSIGPSSVTTAQTWSSNATNSFAGLTLLQTNTYIIQMDVNSGVKTKYPAGQALSAAADITKYIYDIQVEMQGQIEPLVRFGAGGEFGSVPGLTTAYQVVVRSQYTSEVPQGLNK